MAKKKETISPEEMLQNALVPDWEQPYSVSENWVWTRLGYITTIVGGGTPSSNVKDYYENGTIPWISPADLSGYGDIYISHGKKNITKLGLSKSSAKIIPKDSVLLSSRAPIGYVAVAANELSTSQGFKSFLPSKGYIPKYLYWFLRGNKDILESMASGTTFLELSGSKAAEILFPIAPLTEQQRIVDRIESLFFKIDEAKEKAQAALDSFEKRKYTILHKAFTGELTYKWREETGVSLESWENKLFQDVAMIKTNLVNPAEYLNYPHIAPDNIEKKSGKLLSYNTIGEDGVTSGKYRFYFGQILYSKIRPYLSKVVIANFDGLCSADMYPIEAKEYTKYLWYYMLSESFVDQASNAGSRSVLPKINKKELSGLTVPMCSIKEQNEIVRILDSIFEKEQKAKELSDIIEKIDMMKKAILARAFRGELGTNDPEEESANEQLKCILADRIITVPLIKGKDKTEKIKSVLILEENNMPRTILEALSEYRSLTPEKLRIQIGIMDIDDFYAELKNLVDTGVVIERREGEESYLEVNDAGRQA